MAKFPRLGPVARVAEHEEQASARTVGASRARLDAKSAQLEELQRYSDEYAHQTRSLQGQSISPHLLSDRFTFVERLHTAIDKETETEQQLRQELLAHTRQWQSLHGRAEALRLLCDREVHNEARKQSYREQAEADDRPRPQANAL